LPRLLCLKGGCAMYTQTYYFSKDVYYKEILSHCPPIESYFEINNVNKKTIITIPDCCSEIHFFYNDPNPAVYIAGTSLIGRKLKIPITGKCFGVRFKPILIPNRFKKSLDEIIDSNYEITSCHPFDSILNTLRHSHSFEERIQIFNQQFQNDTCTTHPLVNYIISEIQEKGLRANINEIIKHSCYSHRQVSRIFKNNTGLSIKFFNNVLRIQTAIYLLKTDKTQNMTELADNLGFYDQSHFNHNFKQFTCRTPGSFFTDIYV
jgi:AraC-like DNA-binding protein